MSGVVAPRVACIGECMVELRLPPGGGVPSVGFAGDTFNAAVYLKRAAGDGARVAYVTALGTDQLSDRMLDFFAAQNLETDLVERREDRVPGLYAITTDERGERSFAYWRETSAARTLFTPPARVTPESLDAFDLIYLSGITLAVLGASERTALFAAIERRRGAGGRVAFDSNYRPKLWPDRETAQAEIGRMWELTDIALPSLDDELALFGASGEAAVLDRLAAAGVREGALKRSAEGPLPIGWDGPLPEFPEVADPVDTTAAGDSFNGGYLAALLAGAPVPERLMAGHATASRVIMHPGAIVPA